MPRPKKPDVCPWCGHDLDVIRCPVLGAPCNRAIRKNGKVECLMDSTYRAEAEKTGRCEGLDAGI